VLPSRMPTKPKQRTKPVARPERRVRLRVICQRPPSPQQYGAEFGLQDNSTTTEWVICSGRADASGDIHFECECRVRSRPQTGSPIFLGPFVHGDASRRFLYLSWRPRGWRPGQPEPACWLRRIKVQLSSISWEQIEEALRSGGVLEAVVPGTGRDGGPSCASVPLVGGGWSVRNA